jgi:hypothetical protein
MSIFIVIQDDLAWRKMESMIALCATIQSTTQQGATDTLLNLV